MQKQKGFSLLEILITLLIMSFGLLGISGIIVNSLKNNQSSYARSQASFLANDIIERMRSNRTMAEKSTRPYNLAIGAAPSGTGVAMDDLTQWRTNLAAALVSGTGSIAMDVNKKVTVIVQWDDSRASGNETSVGLSDQTITIETRL